MDFFNHIQKQDNNDAATLAKRNSEILEFGTESDGNDTPLDFEICKGLTFTLD